MTNNNIGSGTGYSLFGITTGRLTSAYNGEHDHYDDLVAEMRVRFSNLIKGKKLFTTDATGLYEAYINGFPVEQRQYYTCRECEHFINRVGGLVAISEKGQITPVLWEGIEVPTTFIDSVEAMSAIVKKAHVNGVYIPDNKRVGVAKTGEWTHFTVDVPKALVHSSKIKTAYQVAAEKKEDFGMLVRAMFDFNTSIVEQALGLLRSESLYRSEKCLGVAEWFKSVQDSFNSARGEYNKRNVLWLAVANAPTGFTHIRSTTIGTLLEDLKAGLPFNIVKKRFEDKMDPMKHMRPQSAPKAGTIARANKIVEALKAEGALSRRFARVEELKLEWAPRVKKVVAPQTGIFSHLSPKQKEEYAAKQKNQVSGTKNITWDKFARTVLPYAESIELLVKSGRDVFSAIVTAEHLDAPPIIQWDSEEQRNPFNWYIHRHGSTPSQFNVSSGYRKVTGITLQPSMWYAENNHQGKAVFFILEGAKDTQYKGSGIALFPSTLKSEYHEIRSAIEAYSNSETLKGYEEASACGIRLQYGMGWDTTVRVTTSTEVTVYKLDRWD